MNSYQELSTISNAFTSLPLKYEDQAALNKIKAIESSALEIGRSSSGSWLGYQAYVYYRGYAPPPPGDYFSKEWGFYSPVPRDKPTNWIEYGPQDTRNVILSQAGIAETELEDLKKLDGPVRVEFENLKAELDSILFIELKRIPDDYLSTLAADLKRLIPMTSQEFAHHLAPTGKILTRDSLALSQGLVTPPHIQLLSELAAISCSFELCRQCSQIALRAANHIRRQQETSNGGQHMGGKVFIGHGGSNVWLILKDFISERLHLSYDEFNRVPIAGHTNVVRLSQMLDNASIAFIVMTAEDETADGNLQARMNVIHEAGLFQGRLGFDRAIVLLEDGCSEFSNIHGLGQIRFPKGNISAKFEEIRMVLEREGLLPSPTN